jgi:hypothetical protein
MPIHADSKDPRQKVLLHKQNNVSGLKIAAMPFLAVPTVYRWINLHKENGKGA